MPNHETLHAIKGILRESLRLGPDARIDDDMPLVGGTHDLDSLDTLLIITNIEKKFGIKILERTLDKRVFSTVSTLAEHVDLRRASS